MGRLHRWVAFTESPSILLAFGFKNAKPESLGAAFFECLDLLVHLLDRIFMLWRRRFEKSLGVRSAPYITQPLARKTRSSTAYSA